MLIGYARVLKGGCSQSLDLQRETPCGAEGIRELIPRFLPSSVRPRLFSCSFHPTA